MGRKRERRPAWCPWFRRDKRKDGRTDGRSTIDGRTDGRKKADGWTEKRMETRLERKWGRQLNGQLSECRRLRHSLGNGNQKLALAWNLTIAATHTKSLPRCIDKFYNSLNNKIRNMQYNLGSIVATVHVAVLTLTISLLILFHVRVRRIRGISKLTLCLNIWPWACYARTPCEKPESQLMNFDKDHRH